MTATASSPNQKPRFVPPADRLRTVVYPLIFVGAAGVFFWLYPKVAAGMGAGDARFRVDLSPLLAAPWLIQLHVAGAITSFLLGCVIMAQRKGSTLHRTLGWIWVVTMFTAALTSFFIRSNPDHSFSWIHAISAWTVIALPVGLAAIRMRHVRTHARFMTGLFIGGMMIAGLFTFMPGRMMWTLFFQA
jgi:uncharacterized membrane protein